MAANALTVIVTFGAESVLKRKKLRIKEMFGVLLTVMGIYLIF